MEKEGYTDTKKNKLLLPQDRIDSEKQEINADNNEGFTLVELIVCIVIMMLLVGVLTQSVTRWINKSRKAADMDAAETIGKAYMMALAEYPWVEDLLIKFRNEPHCPATVTATVNGVTERYKVTCVLASEKTYFIGNDSNYKGNGFYELLNELAGLKMKDGANPTMMPRYKIKRSGNHPLGGKRKYQVVDRWRIVARIDTGEIEVWSACEAGYGGYPCYRVWPNPDDAYK